MSRFVGDARDFRRPDEARVLILTRDLLDELGVASCGRDDQERAVKQWLLDNEPNKILALSLSEDGFLAENVSNNLSNARPRTGRHDGGRTAPEAVSKPHDGGRSRTKRHPPGRDSEGS